MANLSQLLPITNNLVTQTDLTTSLASKVTGAAATSSVSGDLKLYEATANGTNYVSFKAPNTLAGNVTWVLPSVDGTNGQALVTNGSGVLAWGSASRWTLNGSDISYSAGNVIVGNANSLRLADSDSSHYVALKSPATVAANVTWTLPSADGTNGQLLQTDGSGALSWVTSGASAWSITGSDVYRSSGSVGIGSSTAPSTKAQRQWVAGNGYSGNGSGVTGSTLPYFLIDGLGCDNSGSVNPVGVQLVGGGGGTPRGLIVGTYGNGRNTTKDAMLFAANTTASAFSQLPNAGAYRGPLSAVFAPASWEAAVNNGGMTSFGVYDNNPGDYDGSTKAGIQVQLAGGYSGGSPGAWGGYCYTARIATNFGSGSSGTNFGYYADITNAGSGNNWGVYIANGNAAKPGGGSWTATSDSRVKTVLGNYARGLQELLQINPIDFEYNGKGGHAPDGHRYTGVIAQDLQAVMPEMVSSRKGKLNESDEDETDILMVDNSALVYALVNAAKELKAELDAVKVELDAVKGELALLKNQ